MGPLGWPEIIIILVVLLLLFGAKRLPEMGRSLGRGMREFKDAVTNAEPPKPAEIGTTTPAPTTTQSPPATPAPTEAAPQQQQPPNERAAS
jgi:sec-independent protein translocase protein TatA